MKKILVLKRITGFLIAAIVMLTICVSAADYRMIEPPVKAGDTFKNFKVKTTEGKSYDLYLELKEKELAFIVIWFANCEFTGVILSCTQSISHQYEDRVSFIAVNPFDDNKAIKKHNESRGFTTPSANI